MANNESAAADSHGVVIALLACLCVWLLLVGGLRSGWVGAPVGASVAMTTTGTCSSRSSSGQLPDGPGGDSQSRLGRGGKEEG